MWETEVPIHVLAFCPWCETLDILRQADIGVGTRKLQESYSSSGD
jgi:hypothetical protein